MIVDVDVDVAEIEVEVEVEVKTEVKAEVVILNNFSISHILSYLVSWKPRPGSRK